MIDFSPLLTLSILITLVVFVLMVLFYLIRTQKKYDQIHNRALIDDMRASFEKSIYQLTDRLVSTQERWMDANHLVIASQGNTHMDINKEESVYLTEFLKSNGVSVEDLRIEKNLVLVLTPFNTDFDSTFETIRQVCSKVNLKCLRGDEEYIKSDVFAHILKLIVRANIIIANINGRNPNVFYELGLAHALNKNTIMVSRAIDKLPIDVKSKYMILYEDERGLEIDLRTQLLKIYTSK
jgi:hypothetical protein